MKNRWKWLAKTGLALCVVAVLLFMFLRPTPFLDGLVPNEHGFEGAVTVVETEYTWRLGAVTVRVPYIGIEGDAKTGLARLIVHRRALASGEPLPAFCHVHYEKSIDGAKTWCDRGWAVFTAHYTDEKGESPIDCSVGNGNNLARAIIQWARRLPFIDRTRLHIDGGSQGGYMALAMSADLFPVTSTTADVPVVNWAYNLSYFEANKGPMRYPAKMDESPLPILASVTMLADWSYRYFPNDLSNDAWYYVSPISHVDRIANPVLVMSATGDMLVPIEQMTRQHVRAFEPARFPEGYRRDLDSLTLCDKARVTFEEVLPPERVFTRVMPLQEDSFEITLDMFKDSGNKPKRRPGNEDRPWSPDHQWSLLYLDEGGPAPQAGHTTFEWDLTPDSFVEHYQRAAPSPGILNAAKLEHLMRRYRGELANLPVLRTGKPANRLNYPVVEQRDVITGLLDYADLGPEHTARLESLYLECPVKPFGDSLNIGALRQQAAASRGAREAA